MGILFDSVMTNKRKLLIKELRDMNVSTSENGTNLEELDFDELNYEFVQALFKRIDVSKDDHSWF